MILHPSILPNHFTLFPWHYTNLVCVCGSLWEFKMREGTPNNKKSSSVENPKNNVRKGSVEGSSHLEELKDRGKKVLKRLIPSESIVRLPGQILKLVERGADTLKRQLRPPKNLLPSLTLKNMQAELYEKAAPREGSFAEMDQQLNHSLLFFLQAPSGEAEEADILRLQTEKCYRKIPRCFFEEHFSGGELGRLLTRDRKEAFRRGDQLSDYYDEVQFNVNQQVAYKLKVFMTFVSFLTSIGNLADLSILKIKHTRVNNVQVREKVVERAERVNSLRERKEATEQLLVLLNKVKKMKKLENMLMSQVQAKGRIVMAQPYQDYCQVHEEVKDYCCPKLVCRYWDLAYYVERGYHDSFSRSLKSYIREIIVLQESAIKSILQPKQDYQTVSNPKRELTLNMGEVSLDQSYEVDEGEVELVTKHNIQRQIVSIFRLGLRKCTYSTDQICQQIRNAIQECFSQLFIAIRGDFLPIDPKPIPQNQRKSLLDKLPLVKYVKIVEEWSSRMKKVVRRQASVIQKALCAARDLREDFPEKEQVIDSYLMQILYITFLEVDQSIGFLIKGRKLKLHQTDPVRQLLLCSQQWKELVVDFKTFPNIWEQLVQHFANSQGQRQSGKKIEGQIIEGLLGKFLQTRRKVVELMVDVFSKTSIENLPLRLQEDEWRIVSIPNRYYNTLGEVVFGNTFSKHIQSVQRKLLSSSLLLERNSSLIVTHEHLQPPTQTQSVPQFDLQVSETVITLNGQSHKVIGGTLSVIDFLHGYLQWVQQSGEGELLQETVLGKVMEFIIMVNENIKKLILGKEALNYGKIKSKSITAKHLVTTYAQLRFFKGVTMAIAKRFSSFTAHSPIICGLLDKNMLQISKKFRAILQLAINESINKIVVDPRKPIAGPVPQTIQIVTAVNRSSEYVREILSGGDKEMGQFVGVPWCGRYLDQVKSQYRSVYKSIMNSNGTRKSKDIDWTDNIYWKFKELQYVVTNLEEFREYLPGFDAIVGELEVQRKKLENPQ